MTEVKILVETQAFSVIIFEPKYKHFYKKWLLKTKVLTSVKYVKCKLFRCRSSSDFWKVGRRRGHCELCKVHRIVS